MAGVGVLGPVGLLLMLAVLTINFSSYRRSSRAVCSCLVKHA